ncbi:hypothetical protein N2152v2_009242 [Parachlorella kessleri]
MRSKATNELEVEGVLGFLEESLPANFVAVPYKLVQPLMPMQPLSAVVVATGVRVRQKAALTWPGSPALSPNAYSNSDAPGGPAGAVQRRGVAMRAAAAAASAAIAAGASPKSASKSAKAGRTPGAPPRPAAITAAVAPMAALPSKPAAAAVGNLAVAAPTVSMMPMIAPTAQPGNPRSSAIAEQAGTAAEPAQPTGEATTDVRGRPARKRKQTSMGDDMIPPDAIFRPFTKTKRSKPQPLGLAEHTRASAAATKSRATEARQLASEQVEQQHHQHHHELGHVPPFKARSAPQLPYKLVAPVMLPMHATPVVVLASPANITHLAKQLEEEERSRAAAAADAVVMVQVLPRPQVPPTAKASRAAGAAVGIATSGVGKSSKQDMGERPTASRQRLSRPSRRATPEPTAQQPGRASAARAPQPQATAGVWHPGLEVYGGITYVDALKFAAAQPPPVVVGFSDDPVRASLEYAKHMARIAGQLPTYSGPLQQAVAAEQRLYQSRLQRAMYARRLRVVHTADPEDQTATRMGSEFQAQLPTLQPRPAAPTPEESRWLDQLIMKPHNPNLPAAPLDELARMAIASEAERAVWVDRSQQQLSAAVGSLAAISLGLETMGSCIGGSWTEEEEEALCAGMRAYGRDFHAIQSDYVPSRSVHDLIDYYYNVLKLKATRRAVQWYQDRAQAEADHQAELERQEQAREAELQRRAERQGGASKRRQLREVVGWLKAAAKNPKDAAFNRPIVMDRAARAAKVIGNLSAAQ